MFKVHVKQYFFFFTCIVGLMIWLQYQIPMAHAAEGTIDLAMPNNVPLIGHPGTKVQLSGTGLTPGTQLSLFSTPANDPAKCSGTSLQNPAAAQLAPFSTSPSVTTDEQGNFQLTTNWPDNANNPTTNYYVCAIPSSGGQNATGVLSTKSFTVAEPVAVQVAPQSVQPGGTITVSGTGWQPAQTLNVSVDSYAGTLVRQRVPAGNVDPMSGNFSTTLTIPANAQGSYTVKVYAVNEQTMSKTVGDAFTVSQQATATPQATATATATATPTQAATTPTPTSTTAGNNGGGGMNLLIFGLGGLGAVLVVIGITVYVVYSRGRTS